MIGPFLCLQNSSEAKHLIYQINRINHDLPIFSHIAFKYEDLTTILKMQEAEQAGTTTGDLSSTMRARIKQYLSDVINT